MNRNTLIVVLVLVALVALVWFATQPRGTAPQATPPIAGTLPDAPPETATAEVGAVRFVSWNIANLGRSKNEEEIGVMADLLRDFDLVAIQEVVQSEAGPQAVARLVDALERRGFDWDYRISDPTTGRGPERYAFLWKPSRVRLVGQPWLEASLADVLDREPYMARFASGDRTMLVANFHAVPTSKDPEEEIVRLQILPERYPDDALLIAGDFNLHEDHEAFLPLYELGLAAALDDQRTTYKQIRSAEGEHLASEYDNLFFEPLELDLAAPGVLDFADRFPTLKAARYVSDHLPVYATVRWP